MRLLLAVAVGLALAQSPPAARAEQPQELLELKNTILNLVDALVEQGVLTPERAASLKDQAVLKAREQAAQAIIAEGAATEAVPSRTSSPDTKVVRVPYVPEFVKDQIRTQVRAELREEVTSDVIATAREERWGIPDALPDWITSLRISGDARLRYQGDFNADRNIANSIPDFLEINAAGGVSAAGADAFFNTTEDRHRYRARLRLGLDADIADSIRFGVRVATAGGSTPVSRNQSLGDYGRGYSIILDRMYVTWTPEFVGDDRWLTLTGGRTGVPYAGTDLIWDDDLNLDGFIAAVSPSFGSGAGSHGPTMTFGGFVLDEQESSFADDSSNDKALLGGQVGYRWQMTQSSSLQFALGYFDFVNVVGRRNTFGSVLNDWTAPGYLQKGNSLYDIRNDSNVNTGLFALASDYSIASAFGEYRYTGFAPFEVVVAAEYVKNLAYDESEILERTGVMIPERSTGYMLRLELGAAQIETAGQWSVLMAYRYLQRDAVLDAITESDFHLGGTDTKGWVLGAQLGLADNLWLRAKWLSADEIDGPPLGIDVLQFDLNARF